MTRSAHTALFTLTAALALMAATPAQAQPPERRGGPADIERLVVVTDDGGSRLGLTVRDAGPGAATGVVVEAVTSDSPAAKAGFRQGDVVTAFDGERVRSLRQFTRLVRESVPGRAVSVSVQRDGTPQTLSVSPESGTERGMPVVDPDALRVEIERALPREIPMPPMPQMPGMRRRPQMPPTPDRPDAEPFGRTPMWRDRPGRPMGPSAGRLGLLVLPLSPQLRTYFAAPAGGVLVSEVEAASPAAKAGVKAGDVIVTINGLAVRDAGDLVDGVREAGPSAPVTLGLVRERKPLSITVPAPAEGRGRPAE